MMKIGLIGDIHANLPALTAVLAALETQAVDVIVSTGDLVGYLPDPNEVLALLRSHHVLAVQGNHDARFGQLPPVTTDVAQLKASASFIWTSHTLTPDNRAYLTNLPTTISFAFGETKVQIVHGSHRRNNEYLYPEAAQLAKVAQEVEATIFVSGHTHEAYVQEVAGTLFINPGSVGKPKVKGAVASYAILTLDGVKPTVCLKQVSYDAQALCTRITTTPGIDAQLAALFPIELEPTLHEQ